MNPHSHTDFFLLFSSVQLLIRYKQNALDLLGWINLPHSSCVMACIYIIYAFSIQYKRFFYWPSWYTAFTSQFSPLIWVKKVVICIKKASEISFQKKSVTWFQYLKLKHTTSCSGWDILMTIITLNYQLWTICCSP